MFVAAFVNCQLHLGNTSTSRAEGGHSALKSNIRSSRGDLFAVFAILRNSMHDQQHRVFEMLDKSRVRWPLVSRPVFGQVGRPSLPIHTKVANIVFCIVVVGKNLQQGSLYHEGSFPVQKGGCR